MGYFNETTAASDGNPQLRRKIDTLNNNGPCDIK